MVTDKGTLIIHSLLGLSLDPIFPQAKQDLFFCPQYHVVFYLQDAGMEAHLSLAIYFASH